ncbi:MAG: DUF2125 domain-containing protein [Paracoccaceae bacterium]
MRTLAVAAVLAVLGWSAWWVVSQSRAQARAQAAVAAIEARGFAVAHDGIAVRGFPSRLDTTVEAPRVTGPGLSLAVDRLRSFALTYAPDDLIAIATPRIALTLAGRSYDIRAEDLRASMDAPAGIDAATLEAAETSITGPEGTWRVSRLIAAFRPGAGGGRDVFLDLFALGLPDAAAAQATAAGLPDTLAEVAVEGVVEGTTLTIRALTVDWDGARITGSGTARIAPGGLTGRLSLDAPLTPAQAAALGLAPTATVDLAELRLP